MIHWCLFARWLVMGRCPAVWVNVCHFPHKWKHLDTGVCPEVRAVEALTHKVAGRQPVEEMRKEDWWRERSVTHTEGPHTHILVKCRGILMLCTVCIIILGYCVIDTKDAVCTVPLLAQWEPSPLLRHLWKLQIMWEGCWNVIELILHSTLLWFLNSSTRIS